MGRIKRGVLSGKIIVIHLTSLSAWIGLVGSMQVTTAAPEENYHICNSSVCLQRAKEINESLDPCVDPCTDFYSYACGGWIKNHTIPESKSSYGAFDMLRDELTATIRDILGNMTIVQYGNQNVTDKVAVMYNACLAVEEKGDQIADLMDIMEERGLSEWPIICEEECNASFRNWSKVLLKAGMHYVLEMGIGRDTKHNSSYIIQMDQVSFSPVGRNQLIYPNKTQNEKIITAYKKLIAEAIKLMSPNTTEPRLGDLASTLVDFEGQLANLTAPPEERRDILKLYHRTTVKDLQTNFSDFPLLDLLNKEFAKINVTLNESEPVEIYALDYYGNLVEFLNNEESTTFFNYVGMKTMISWASYASQKIRNASLDLKKAKTGVQHDIERWEKCVGLASAGMQDAIGHLYVTKKFSPEAKEEVEDLVRRLKDVFNETIKNSTWMDNTTKSEAEKKLTKMKSKIGYPDWILNTTYLELLYRHVAQLNLGSSFLWMWRNITDNNWERELGKLRSKYDPETEWVVGPAVVNAFYNPTGNEMVYPSGILQGPFYQHGLPRSLNFGAIGVVVGHELTHGFDDTGSQFDADGGLRQWWSNRTRTEFDKRAKCFIDQYGSICDEKANMTLNGQNTVGENIADNGGLRTAFGAYEKLLSEDCEGNDTRLQGLEDLPGEKLFFIANAMGQYADEELATVRHRIQLLS